MHWTITLECETADSAASHGFDFVGTKRAATVRAGQIARDLVADGATHVRFYVDRLSR